MAARDDEAQTNPDWHIPPSQGGDPMKAIRIHEFGGPDRVQLEEVGTPKVTRGKALVRIRAAGVNPVDWMVREHRYNPKGADRVPLTLGQDFARVIEKIGGGSKTPLREGDEVFGEVFGSFAEYALVPVKDLVKKPPLTRLQGRCCAADAGADGLASHHRHCRREARNALPHPRRERRSRSARGAVRAVEGGRGGSHRKRAEPRLPAIARSRSRDRLQARTLRREGARRRRGAGSAGRRHASARGVLKRGGMLLTLIGEIDEK